MSSNTGPFIKMRNRLAEISPSFCAAKWLQVTTHLHKGITHSCHHTKAHKIPILEVEKDPSALHNTLVKKKQRRKMLEGSRPVECEHCWKIEDLPGDSISDRFMKSSEFWAEPYLDFIKGLHWRENISPTYFEISFSRSCNFKCSYCSPEFSSQWNKEIKRFGGYSSRPEVVVSEDRYPDEESNPFIHAFWKWWPELKRGLKVFRITGGEPLLSENTFRILETLAIDPEPNLEIAVNSNLGVPRLTIDRLIALVNPLLDQKKIVKFTLFTSIEAWGKPAEYIRFGMDFQKYWDNLNHLLFSMPRVQIVIMSTFNLLSITSFGNLIEEVGILRSRFRDSLDFAPLIMDISYLRHPLYQSIEVLPRKFSVNLDEMVKTMEKYSAPRLKWGFYAHEISKLKRLVILLKNAERDLRLNEYLQSNFVQFFKEHDRRRKTDFLATFPELSDFWDQCSKLIPIAPPALSSACEL